MITEKTLDPIRDKALARSDLAAIIEQDGTTLAKVGGELRGLCPFHADRNPSLAVFGANGRQRFKCYGCDASGDAIDWIQRKHGKTYVEAIETLAGEPALRPSEIVKPKRVFPTAAAAVEVLTAKHGKPAGRWIYRDSAGVPCGVVLRWNSSPRKIYQPVSKVPSGWSIVGMAKPRPLYRLPELLAADPADPVFVCEGEKSVEAAVAAGLIATTSANGAQSPEATDWAPLRGRRVVLLPDQDAEGEKYVQRVVTLANAAGAAEVRIASLVPLWPSIPEGGDLADLLEDRGGDAELVGREVRDLAQGAPAITPSNSASPAIDPVDLPEPFRPFPIDAIPDPLGRFVSEAASAIGCDSSMVALPLLAAIAAAVGNSRCVELKPGWTEPAILWCLVLCESGTSKSPAFRSALGFVRRHESELRKQHREAVDAHREAEEDHKRAMAKWKARPKAVQTLSDPPQEPGDAPRPSRLLVNDPTVEAIADLLQHNPRGLLLAREELAGWFASFDRYAAGTRGGDAPKWLEAWDGGQWIVDRKQAGGAFVPRVSVSITGTIQPGLLRAALLDRSGQHRESGLAARMLIARPPRRASRWTDAAVSRETQEAAARVFEQLLTLDAGEDPAGSPEPIPVRLDRDARELFIAHHDALADHLADLSGHLAAAWSKLRAYLGRFALLHHLTRRAAGDLTAGDRIDSQSVAAAARLVGWFGAEARRFEQELGAAEGLPEDEQDRFEVVRAAMDHGGMIDARKLYNRNRKRFRPMAKARKLLADAAAAGLGTIDAGGVFRLPTETIDAEPTGREAL